MQEFFDSVYRPLRLVGCASSTLEQYQLTLARWADFAGGLPLGEVDDVLVAEFAESRLHPETDGPSTPRAVVAATVNKDLRHLRAILRLAHQRRLLAEPPRITLLRENHEPPRAFLLKEIQAILAAASNRTGTIDGVPAGPWWTSLILADYDTGGRIGAMLAVRPEDVDLAAGTVHIRASTQKQHEGQMLSLHAQTVEACAAIWSPERERMWPWPFGHGARRDHFRAIIEAAGVETWKTTGSLFHRIRKSTASYVAAAGGDPTYQLGHSSPAVTRRYLDPRICRQRAAELIPRPNLTPAPVAEEL